MKKTLIIAFTFLATLPAFAQEDFGEVKVDAELRNRAEMRQGYATLRSHGDKPFSFVGERARLGAAWEHYNIEAKIAVQHTGVWGDEPLVGAGQKSAMGVSEAWAKYKLLDNGVSEAYVQTGRQQLSYDDERILGDYDWTPTGQSHDALKFALETEYHKLHAVLSVSQTQEPTASDFYDGPTPYKNLAMLWYHNDAFYYVSGSLLLLNVGVESGTPEEHSVQHMQTVGAYLNFEPDVPRLTADASFYYQRGHDASARKLSAFLASANANYQLHSRLSVGAGVDVASGTSPDGQTNHTFQPLYGSANKFYGAMGYFADALPQAGLVDVKAHVQSQLSKRTAFSCHYHYFQLMQKFDYKGFKDAPGKALGHELDLRLDCRLQDYLSVQAGYSVMFPLRTMGLVRPTGHTGAWQHWAWLQLNLRPTIFKKKIK